MQSRNLFRGLGGVAAVAAIILLVEWLAPQSSKSGPRSIDSVSAAMRNLENIDVVEIETEWWAAGQPLPVNGWSATVKRGVGYSGQNRNGDREVYNLTSQRLYRTQNSRHEVVTRRLNDAGMIEEFLRRSLVSDCAEYFSIRRQPGAPIVETVEQRDGRSIRRIEAVDARRQPVIIELDINSDRLLLVDSMILTAEQPNGGIRQTVRFRYPAPETIDTERFDPPSLEGKTVIEEPASRIQCMVNVRNLCMAVTLYGTENDNRLPPNIEALARYAPGGDLSTCRTCLFDDGGQPVEIVYSSPESLGIETVDQLQSDMILFRCRIAGGEVRGFGDSHAEFAKTTE